MNHTLNLLVLEHLRLETLKLKRALDSKNSHLYQNNFFLRVDEKTGHISAYSIQPLTILSKVIADNLKITPIVKHNDEFQTWFHFHHPPHFQWYIRGRPNWFKYVL
jgi:hypothetical protein